MYLAILCCLVLFSMVHVNGSKKHHVISACNEMMFLFQLAIDDFVG